MKTGVILAHPPLNLICQKQKKGVTIIFWFIKLLEVKKILFRSKLDTDIILIKILMLKLMIQILIFIQLKTHQKLPGTNDDNKVVYAMKKGLELTLTGESTRGTITNDFYTLKGFTNAINQLNEEC